MTIHTNTNRFVGEIWERKCPHCKKWFASNVTNFHRRGHGKLHYVCKACATAQTMRYYKPRGEASARAAARTLAALWPAKTPGTSSKVLQINAGDVVSVTVRRFRITRAKVTKVTERQF